MKVTNSQDVAIKGYVYKGESVTVGANASVSGVGAETAAQMAKTFPWLVVEAEAPVVAEVKKEEVKVAQVEAVPVAELEALVAEYEKLSGKKVSLRFKNNPEWLKTKIAELTK